MRILILVDDYYPSTKSGAKMIHDLGVEFLRHGHKVSVVTPSDRVAAGMQVAVEDGIQVVRVRAGNLKYIGRPLRGWRESRLSAMIWSRARSFFQSNTFDLIIFYSPTIFFADLVLRLKALWRCRTYLVLRDVFPQWAVDAGVLRKGGLLHRFFRRIEIRQYDAADVIGVEAPGNLRYFSEELPQRRDRLEVLLNWAELQPRPARENKHRAALGLNGKVVFFYGGNIGVAQDMDNIVRLAGGLRDSPEIFFLLVGSGSEVPRLNSEIQRLGLSNFKILPPVPQQQYLEMLSEFDVGLVSLDRRLQTNSLTGKLLGYMTCGMPILASINSGNDLSDFLREFDAGIPCLNGNDDELRAAALRLAGEPQLRMRMGANARRLLETRFSVQAAARQVLSHFSDTAAASPGEAGK